MVDLKMAEIIATFKIMPSSVDTNLNEVQAKALQILSKEGRVEGAEFQPVAFGLKAIVIYAVYPESIGSGVDNFAEELLKIDGVETCEVTDVRRAIDLG